MAEILIVEDSKPLALTLRQELIKRGHLVRCAFDGKQGISYALSSELGAIVLDINLPELDGLTICKRLRAAGLDTPVLMLTAKASTADIVKGMELGADAYLTKPFNLRELLARLEALLRRRPQTFDPQLTFGKLTIDNNKKVLAYDQQEIYLRPREFKILALLATNANKVLTREQINNQTQPYYRSTREDVVDVHISTIRKRLKELGCNNRINTVYGVGYCFCSGK